MVTIPLLIPPQIIMGKFNHFKINLGINLWLHIILGEMLFELNFHRNKYVYVTEMFVYFF